MDSAGTRLRDARISAGYRSASAAAERLGVGASTYRHHENGNREYDKLAANKYARAFKVTPQWLLYGVESNVSERQPIAHLKVSGAVQAGAWHEAEFTQDNYSQPDMVTLPAPKYHKFDQYLLEVKGTSMNKLFPEGSFVHCVSIDFQEDLMPRNGDAVVVRRTRGGFVETSLKLLKISKRGKELWPSSNDPAHQECLVVNDMPDTDEVKITAIVINSITPFRRD